MEPLLSLRDRIACRIRKDGRPGFVPAGRVLGKQREMQGISFSDYMEMCLYDTEYGYYRSGKVRIGRMGDFYTSSGIGTVMSEMLAACIAKEADKAGLPARIMEWGAGTGRMAVQLMNAWKERWPGFAESLAYSLVDADPVHLKESEKAVREAGFSSEARFLAPDEAAAGLRPDVPLIIVANELLDAFPVHRVVCHDSRLWELGVFEGDNGEEFQYGLLPPGSHGIEASLAADGIVLEEGQEAEVNLRAEEWLAWVGERVGKGILIVIDYGGDAAELTASHRMKGTLLCYHKHLAHDNPFVHIGDQDITAHVNFSACRRAAEAAGWEPVYYGTQKQFLVDNGILEELQNNFDPDPFSQTAKRNRAIRQLLLSDGMSESFKVMILAK